MGIGTQIVDASGNILGAVDRPLYVQGTLTATVDESTLATSAAQATAQTSLAAIAASVAGATPAGTNTIGAVTGPAAAALATSALQTTGNTSLSSIDAKSAAIPTATAAITKSDSTDLTGTRFVYVGTGGDVAIKLTGDSVAVTLSNVPSGTMIGPCAFLRVMSTNTTASGFVGLT